LDFGGTPAPAKPVEEEGVTWETEEQQGEAEGGGEDDVEWE
jgi:hypothetical protein